MRLIGVAKLNAAMARVAVAVAAAATEGKAIVGEGVAEDMRSTVAVDTGETRDSIEVTSDGVEVGGAGLFLEFGTVHMDAQPFARPAADGADGTEAEHAMRATVLGAASL